MATDQTTGHGLADEDEQLRGRLMAIEARITRVHADPSILMDGATGSIPTNGGLSS
jgi:hypothetical protein